MRRYLIIAVGISFFAILFVDPVRDRLSNIFYAKDALREEKDIIGSGGGYNFRVEEIQDVLQNMGFYKGVPDGFLGASTREALRKFQKSRQIRRTGYIDNKTWQILKMAMAERRDAIKRYAQAPPPEAAQNTRIENRDIYDEVINYRLNAKERVKKIQVALKNAGFEPGEIDGRMGKKTQDAVMKFQKKNGLTPDGIVGTKTWETLKPYFEMERRR